MLSVASVDRGRDCLFVKKAAPANKKKIYIR